jgi:hypothetical protein
MIKRLTFSFVLFGIMSAPCIAGDAVTLASFLESIPAQNDQMKDIINASFESGASSNIQGIPRQVIGNTIISEYRFEAFRKGKITRQPGFIVFLEVASMHFSKDGSPTKWGSEYPASVDLKLVGFRVVAFPSPEQASPLKE